MKEELCPEEGRVYGEDAEQYGEESQPRAFEGEPCGESEACANEPCGEECEQYGEVGKSRGEEWEPCGQQWESCGEAIAPREEEEEAGGWSRDELHIVEAPSLKEPSAAAGNAPPRASLLPATPVVMLREAEISEAVETKEKRSMKPHEESTFSTETVLENERSAGEPGRAGPVVERANGVAEMEHEQSVSNAVAAAKPDADETGCGAAAREAAVESETSEAGQVCELELKAKTHDEAEDPRPELDVEVELEPGVREAVEEEMGSSMEESSSAPASLTPAVMAGDCLDVESAPAPASPVTATPSSPTRFTPVSTATPVTRTSPGRSGASECATAPLLPWVRLPTPPLPHPSETFGLSGPVAAPKGLLLSERWQADSESVDALSPTIVDSGGKRGKGVPQPLPTLLDLRVRREWQEKRCGPGISTASTSLLPLTKPSTH
ncbi:hypothetical protein AB1Y20_013879 [Prymnesium parvum]|uniref:Uncharacterized protein n=1 Tax=Prymnesium parvum TaxID=97485 RepID=A0AB34IH16_PRYPA